MNEYELLRAEILDKKSVRSQYDNILYTAVAAILTYAFSKDDYFLCLLPYTVILPLYFLTENAREAIVKLGTYMYVFLEGKEYQWEGRNREFDKLGTENKWLNDVLLFRRRIHYFLVAFICSLSATYKIIVNDTMSTNKLIPLLFVWVFTILSITAMALNMTDYVKTREDLIKRWQAVKAAEEQEARKRNNNRNPQ